LKKSLRKRIFNKHIAIPQDHGSWVFLLSPLLIGLFAGGSTNPGTPFLIVGVVSAFLARQPVSIFAKALTGRRSEKDRFPALFWIVVYTGFGLVSAIGLFVTGYGFVLFLALPALPVFAWHLWLVSRRAERRQAGVEILGSGVLALAAPAAYWVAVASPDPVGWWLWLLTWFQSAASIVYAYLRLEQRELKEVPGKSEKLRMGRRALIYTGFNFLVVLVLSIFSILPTFLWVPFALQLGEAIYGTLDPAVGVKPSRIGMRQLIVSSIFTLLFMLTWSY